MVANDFSFFNGAAGEATLDQLRVGDGVGVKAETLHGVHGADGSCEVSLVAESGEVIEHRQGWEVVGRITRSDG